MFLPKLFGKKRMFTAKTWSDCSGFYGKHPGWFISRLCEKEHGDGRRGDCELGLQPLD